MNVRYLRHAIANLKDDDPVILHMMTAPQDDVNVVIEDIVPADGGKQLNIIVSVVTDAQLDDEITDQ